MLADLREQLASFASGESDLAAMQRWLLPILAADSLDIEQSPEEPWDHAPHDTRLFWRLVYQFEAGGAEEALRVDAGRLVQCLASTGDSVVTYELLPVLLDQDRLCAIVDKHLRGIISRTGFLSATAESGYASHIKLWLERATPESLSRFTAWLASGAYGDAAVALERRPS